MCGDTIDFRKIVFGKSDAATESRRYPNLLIKGYLDQMGVIDKAMDSELFLFLGYKGSGKSALLEHIRLTFRDDPNVFINQELLKSFPYKLFSKIVKGGAEQEVRFKWAWESVILLYALFSIDRDESKDVNQLDEWSVAVETLRDSGLFPIINLSDIVNKASKRTFKFRIPQILENTTEYERREVDTDILIDYVRQLLCGVKTDSRHYLIIDGLDEFLSNREDQQRSVIALINSSRDLNNWFTDNCIPFKVIILCRTDVFIHLSDPNMNKTRQDYSYTLNWFEESETDDYSSSNLIKLANLRTGLVYPKVTDMFKRFFPSTYAREEIKKALLEYTRHTPRDFLQLLVNIQYSCKRNNVTASDIAAGIKKYSSDYFVTEIRDELAGYMEGNDIELLVTLLSQFKKREFKLIDIKIFADKDPRYSRLDLYKAFDTLFECSAIGHLKGEDNKYYIKYRNRNMVFDSNETIILHKGLWKALVS